MGFLDFLGPKGPLGELVFGEDEKYQSGGGGGTKVEHKRAPLGHEALSPEQIRLRRKLANKLSKNLKRAKLPQAFMADDRDILDATMQSMKRQYSANPFAPIGRTQKMYSDIDQSYLQALSGLISKGRLAKYGMKQDAIRNALSFIGMGTPRGGVVQSGSSNITPGFLENFYGNVGTSGGQALGSYLGNNWLSMLFNSGQNQKNRQPLTTQQSQQGIPGETG
jgi:hypothetical protein